MWLEIVGWIGSLLVIVSLMQARVLRFRVLNLVGAVIATAYNAIVGIWPFAVMNGVIAVIDVYWLARLQRERHDDKAYEVVEVTPDDAYLRHVIAVHADDIAGFAPGFTDRFAAVPAGGDGGRAAFLVVRGDETVGVVVVRGTGDGTGLVELDYVTPRFRDFTPGEFVYRRSGVFAAHGFRRLVVKGAVPEQREYLTRVGFRQAAEGWERAVDAAA
ncbi:YgjV family protein [Cellulomonas soli]|nr:YgjV family protein [Cellulomonas soli]NYI58958.1 hypothetical protein [Cellulomonas soli]